MANIRSDLEGVVIVHDRDGLGAATVLYAGDKVPRGITVGDHLLEPAASGQRSQSRTAPAAKATKEPPAPFDPDTHTVEEVVAYLKDLPGSDTYDDELARIVEAEQDGQARKTILDLAAEEDTEPDHADGDKGGSTEAGSDGAQTTPPEPVDRPATSGPGSDKGSWRRYAEYLGLEVTTEMTRADIQAAVEAHESA